MRLQAHKLAATYNRSLCCPLVCLYVWHPSLDCLCPTLRHLLVLLVLSLPVLRLTYASCLGTSTTSTEVTALLFLLVDVEKLGGNGGELWLLVLVGES
jgi:hypothetical protein